MMQGDQAGAGPHVGLQLAGGAGLRLLSQCGVSRSGPAGCWGPVCINIRRAKSVLVQRSSGEQ